MTLIAYVFPKLQTAKDVVREVSKKSCFRRPFHKLHGKRSQTLLKSARQHLDHIYWSLRRQFSSKKFLSVTWKIMGLFLNTLTTDDKYSLLNREKLTQPIQICLSKYQKLFFQLFYAFLKSRLNFEYFEIKGNPHSWCSSEIMDSERPG